MEIFGYISALCFAISYIPQIIKTHRLKTVDDISIFLFVITLVAYICGLIYGIWLNKLPLILNYVTGGVLTYIIILQWYMYRDVRKEKIRKEIRDMLKQLKNKRKGA